MPQVSVIVPIFNGVSYLPLFFESLRGSLPEGSQLILVDDGSTEAVWDTVPEFERAASVLRLQNVSNLGYSVAVNRGFESATGDIIVQLNTDLILQPECITAMVDLIEREKHVGIVGSKLVFPTNGLVEHVGLGFGDLTKRRLFAQLPADHILCNRTRQLQIVSGATVAMTRPVLDLLGPLDERYFNRNEDLDHCLRACQQGLRNFACAESVAHHWRSQSGPSRFARVRASDSRFWSRWGSNCESDLGRFIDEALDHVLSESPDFDGRESQIIDLSRGVDQEVVLECLDRRWSGAKKRRLDFRQMNNPQSRFWLPLLLPRTLEAEPRPFIYLVDCYRELEENLLWFENRRRIAGNEMVIDLDAAAINTLELAR